MRDMLEYCGEDCSTSLPAVKRSDPAELSGRGGYEQGLGKGLLRIWVGWVRGWMDQERLPGGISSKGQQGWYKCPRGHNTVPLHCFEDMKSTFPEILPIVCSFSLPWGAPDSHCQGQNAFLIFLYTGILQTYLQNNLCVMFSEHLIAPPGRCAFLSWHCSLLVTTLLQVTLQPCCLTYSSGYRRNTRESTGAASRYKQKIYLALKYEYVD